MKKSESFQLEKRMTYNRALSAGIRKSGRYKLFETTRSSFVRQVCQGNETAWFELHKKYVGMIRHVGTLRGLSPAECDDLMIDVMVIFWKKMHDFIYDRQQGKFSSYLSKIADLAALKMLSRRERFANIDTHISQEYPDDIDSSIMDEWRDFLLDKALEDLKTDVDTETYQVFYMSFVQNRTVEEISSVTRKTQNNIYVIRSRCIRKLKKLISLYRQMDEEELLLHSKSSRSGY